MARTRILIVEDERNAREALGEVFGGRHDVDLTADVDEALAALEANTPDLVLTDVVLPGDRDGLDLLRQLRTTHPDTPVIVMTAYGSVEKAVRAMRDGAHDFLEKPLDLARLRQLVASALESRAQAPATAEVRAGMARGEVPEGFVGSAPSVLEIFRKVSKVAPTNATVLILGESGTGKELVAEAIHRASPRAAKPFVKVNCAALPEGLLESELFGHVKGSFTGAVSDRPGRFEAADGGTIFLDEVGEVPAHTQVKLLRVLQAREIERVGDNRSRPVDVRMVAATNADLEAAVRKGSFREDFYFRLKVITLDMPALRARRGDIQALAEHFRAMYGERHARDVRAFSPEALELLREYEWPGNVRELENMVEAAVVLSEGDTIQPEDLPQEVGGGHRDEDLPEGDTIRIAAGTPLPEAEKTIILDTLRRTDGNKTAAARILGIGLRTLYRKLELYENEDGEASGADSP
ncbi:MAG: sigma-54 dependent transcriptional regulator [Planctomycetota bacterium]|nr:sigma-54 dependent transcriptional regulator [Planctomycetota bacterium]